MEYWAATAFNSGGLLAEGKAARSRVRARINAMNVSAPSKPEEANPEHKAVPDGHVYTLVDMAAGSFLQDKLNTGGLEIEGLDFSTAVKSITEGDVSTTFAGASDGVSSPEGRFLATLDGMVHPSEKILGAFRKLKW